MFQKMYRERNGVTVHDFKSKEQSGRGKVHFRRKETAGTRPPGTYEDFKTPVA